MHVSVQAIMTAQCVSFAPLLEKLIPGYFGSCPKVNDKKKRKLTVTEERLSPRADPPHFYSPISSLCLLHVCPLQLKDCQLPTFYTSLRFTSHVLIGAILP